MHYIESADADAVLDELARAEGLSREELEGQLDRESREATGAEHLSFEEATSISLIVERRAHLEACSYCQALVQRLTPDADFVDLVHSVAGVKTPSGRAPVYGTSGLWKAAAVLLMGGGIGALATVLHDQKKLAGSTQLHEESTPDNGSSSSILVATGPVTQAQTSQVTLSFPAAGNEPSGPPPIVLSDEGTTNEALKTLSIGPKATAGLRKLAAGRKATLTTWTNERGEQEGVLTVDGSSGGTAVTERVEIVDVNMRIGKVTVLATKTLEAAEKVPASLKTRDLSDTFLTPPHSDTTPKKPQ